jgi:hypothetical protein
MHERSTAKHWAQPSLRPPHPYHQGLLSRALYLAALKALQDLTLKLIRALIHLLSVHTSITGKPGGYPHRTAPGLRGHPSMQKEGSHANSLDFPSYGLVCHNTPRRTYTTREPSLNRDYWLSYSRNNRRPRRVPPVGCSHMPLRHSSGDPRWWKHHKAYDKHSLSQEHGHGTDVQQVTGYYIYVWYDHTRLRTNGWEQGTSRPQPFQSASSSPSWLN